MTQNSPLVRLLPRARSVAANSANAPVNSPAVIVRDPEHQLLGRFVAHLLGQDAGFFRSLMPVFGVVEMRCNGHFRTKN
jgi:hypothetical protein